MQISAVGQKRLFVLPDLKRDFIPEWLTGALFGMLLSFGFSRCFCQPPSAGLFRRFAEPVRTLCVMLNSGFKHVFSDRISSAARLLSAGFLALTALAGPVKAADVQHYHCDVAVIGSGGAGLSAAIAASEAGAQVLVLEKMPMIGGNTILAAGHMLVSAPQFLKNNGDADPFYEELLAHGGESADKKLMSKLVRDSADSAEWLRSLGTDLEPSHTPISDKNICDMQPSDGRLIGPETIKSLLGRVEERRIPIQTLSYAHRILTDEHRRVRGVEVMNPDGTIRQINAPAVVIATGGFSANDLMVSQYLKLPENLLSTNTPGATGDGIVMGRLLGAQTVDLDAVIVHPTTLPIYGLIMPRDTRTRGAVLVNAQGERFADELSPDLAAKIEALPGRRAWLILDQSIIDAMPVLSGYAYSGYFLKGDTDEALARAMHMSPQTFAETMRRYRKAQTAQYDPDFGRALLKSPLNRYPLYAVSITPGIHRTLGGLRINENAQVLSEEGAIPGLFAAGEVTGGIFGHSRLEGLGITNAVVFGRTAGASAADYALQSENRANH